MVKSLIDVPTQIGVFMKYKNDLFQPNGKPKQCTDKIYDKLVKELNGMSRKAIQVSINRNIKSIVEDDQVPSVSNIEFEFVNANNNYEADDNVSVQSDHKDTSNVDSFGLFPSEFLDVNVLTDETLDPQIQTEPEQEADQSFPVESHSEESFYELYHKSTLNKEQVVVESSQRDQHFQKLFNETSREVTLFAEAHHQRIQSLKNVCYQQHEKVAELQAEKNGLINRLKAAEEKLNSLRAEIERLVAANDNISREHAVSQSQLQLKQQSLSEQDDIVAALRSENIELINREKLDGEKLNSLRAEIERLVAANDNISREHAVSQSQLQLKQQSLSEQDDIVAALRSENIELINREKLDGEKLNSLEPCTIIKVNCASV